RSPLGSAARVLLMETQLQRTQQGTHTAPTTPPTDTTA
ncbi:MAG: hypothetical protein RLZ04_942, partial [Actinomycetota bacterium]